MITSLLFRFKSRQPGKEPKYEVKIISLLLRMQLLNKE